MSGGSSPHTDRAALQDELLRIREAVRRLHDANASNLESERASATKLDESEEGAVAARQLLQLWEFAWRPDDLRRAREPVVPGSPAAAPAAAASSSPKQHLSRCCWAWVCAAEVAPVLLTAPFYACVTYDEWYIDELFAIVRNPDVLGERPLKEIWRHDFWGQDLWPTGGNWTHKSFRPVAIASFRWQVAGGEPRAAPMRLANCALHTINVVLLRLLLGSLGFQASGWAAIASALFALHPVHLENLPYLVGRADSMAATFILCGLLLRWRARSLKRRLTRAAALLAAGACAPLAGLCKETGFMLPAILAWEGLALGRAAATVADLLWLVLLMAARTLYVGGTDVGFSYVDTPVRYASCVWTRTLSYLLQHSVYGQLLILPWNQSWDYSFDAIPLVRSFRDVRVLAILTAYGALVAITAHAAANRNASTLLSVGLVVLPFLPCSNLFFLVGTTVAERLLYPSTIGWSLLIAALGTQAERARLGRCRRVGGGAGIAQRVLPRLVCRTAAALLCMFYAYRAGVRLWQWRTRVAIYEADMQVWHRSAKVVHQYASLLHGGGRLEEALGMYSRSLEIFDDNALTDYCVARVLMQLGRYEEAETRFQKIAGGHGIGFGRHNMYVLLIDYGWVLARLGRYRDAIQMLEQGVRLRPHVVYAWNALGVARANSAETAEDLQQAMDCLLKAVELDPRNAALWSNVAAVASTGGALEPATQAMQNALALGSSEPGIAWNARVLLAGESGRPTLDLFLGTA